MPVQELKTQSIVGRTIEHYLSVDQRATRLLPPGPRPLPLSARFFPNRFIRTRGFVRVAWFVAQRSRRSNFHHPGRRRNASQIVGGIEPIKAGSDSRYRWKEEIQGSLMRV